MKTNYKKVLVSFIILCVVGIICVALKFIEHAEGAYLPLTSSATWQCVTKTYTNLATAGATNNIEAFVLPANGLVQAVQIVPVTAFSGGTIATYTLSIGIAGNLTKYSTATNVFTGATLPVPSVNMGIESTSGSTSIRVAAISTVGLLNAATQGSARICALISQLP